jgi:cytochrome c5
MAYYTIKDLNKFGHRLAKEIAQNQGTQRQWHPVYSDISHPDCETPGCTNPKIVMDWHWTSGKPVYRTVCQHCHDANTADRYAKKTGALWVKTVKDVVAHKAGFNSVTDYINSKHPYRQYRKDYCENIDSRLGYKCTTTIVWDGQLDVDHIDENPSNNNPANLQTLCKCCHAYKSNVFIKENGVTPGRKSLGILY